MGAAVRLRDGIEITCESGDTIHLDGSPVSGPAVLSHAHGDHLIDEAHPLIASPLTAVLAAVRQNTTPRELTDHPAVDLVNAGHIAGSRAVHVTDQQTGRTYLYTGDCCTRDRFYLDGFVPMAADVLIIESTYGKPTYRFPPTDVVVSKIKDWLADTMDDVVILFGYALGRAQKLQRILQDSARNRVFTTEAVCQLNAVIEEYLDVSFEVAEYSTDVTLTAGDALVLPMQTSRLAWIGSLIEKHDAITAGFSGWAVDDSFIYQRGYDRGFILSDHCDFSELRDIVTSVDPDVVYTHHGFTDAFANHLTTNLGVPSQALKQNQATLGDF